MEQKQQKPVDLEIISRTSMDKMFSVLQSPYKIWNKTGIEKKKELYNFIFAEDFCVDRNYTSRTPVLSPIYLYLQDISAKTKDAADGVPDLWRWAESNRRATGKVKKGLRCQTICFVSRKTNSLYTPTNNLSEYKAKRSEKISRARKI